MPWTNKAFEAAVSEREERFRRAVDENIATERARVRARLWEMTRRLAEDREAEAEVEAARDVPN